MSEHDENNVSKMRYAQWLFLGPALIHLWWARCVFHSAKPLYTTGLTDLYAVFNGDRVVLGIVLVLVGIMAVASIIVHRWSIRWSIILLCPQQMAMLVSAWTAWRCIRSSRFADGLPYDSDFISADQCYIFVIGLMHTALIVHVYLWDGLVRLALKVRG